MKKIYLSLLSLLTATSFSTSCNNSKRDMTKVISVCASESPHAEILNDAVKPLLEKEGYELDVTVLDWTLQNENTYNGDYDANYFQHRPFLQEFDSGNGHYNAEYTYTKLFPTALVHFEPLRIYASKSSASEFSSKKETATFVICADSSNAVRALDLLVDNQVINSYVTDNEGKPIVDSFPKRIVMVAEELLVSTMADYDYAVLPCNTALTGNVKFDDSLPTETDAVKEMRANIVAASVNKYKDDATYKTKIDALTDCFLDSSVSEYILSKYNGFITPVLKDCRK